jgi:protein phosphatase
MPQTCVVCGAQRKGDEEYCSDCGCVFSAATAPSGNGAPSGGAPASFVKNRYELTEMINERGNVSRFKALDRGAGALQPVPVILLRQPAPPGSEPAPAAEEAAPAEAVEDDGDITPSFDGPDAAAPPPEAIVEEPAVWPSLGWEKNLLETYKHPALPRVLDHFIEDGQEYLVEEIPVGQPLGNCWDDPDFTTEQKWTWLKQAAEGLREIHKGKAILEGIRPDLITVTSSGQAVLNDLSDLLPLPLPPNAPVRGTHYTAPEVVAMRSTTDARADLYGFGAMIYGLVMGHDVNESDFDKKSGIPKNFIARLPDIHPLIGRIVSKTFQRDPLARWPSDEAGKKDPTGFTELVDTLASAAKVLSHVRMEVASWTTTGIVRTGNEDAFNLIHAAESRLEDFSEYTLVVLADGMGGYEAGEVAAALCIQTLRTKLSQQKVMAAVHGDVHPNAEEQPIEEIKKLIVDSMKEANEIIHKAPSKGIGRRGMGCTCEVVYVDNQHIVVGHVGDSRTYHLQDGRLNQLTRDQTLVNRLVELGQLKAEEAESHPRKNELQQAMGGRPFVDPAVYAANLKPGDWIVVCSDGVTGHIKNEEIQEMLQNEAFSAEVAARRLVNFCNLRGATDNATIVVIRCT